MLQPMKKTLLTGAIIFGIIAAMDFLPFVPIVSYTAAKIASSILFLLFAYFLFRSVIPEKFVFGLLIAFFALRLLYINAPPVGSDDLYRYLWDGKVQTEGIDPYLYAPNAPELQRIGSELLPARVNHPDMQTMYFPLSEWIFALGYLISGEQVWGYKLLLFFAELSTLAGLFLFLRKQKIETKFILLYAACPLIVFEYSVDGHVDLFGMTFLLFFLYHYLNKRYVTALILLGCSFSIKPAALIVLPILFFAERGWKKRFMIVFIPIITLGVQFLPYLFTSDPFVSLYAFTKHWTFNGFFYNLADLYFHNNQPARIACGIALLTAIGILSFSRISLLNKIYSGFLLLLLFSPIVHPWYIGWVTLFNPFMKKWSGIYYSAGAGLTGLTAMNYQLYGVWKDYWPVLIIEYIPVLIFFVLEIKRMSHSTESNPIH